MSDFEQNFREAQRSAETMVQFATVLWVLAFLVAIAGAIWIFRDAEARGKSGFAAALIAFLALIALVNGLLGWGLGLVGVEGITLEVILGWVFAPVAWLMGVPTQDISTIGSLFGVKMVANEFVAFQMLSDILSGGGNLSPKSIIIATYALTGFANFSSIAIQIGGIGGIAPERRHDLSKLGMRAMLGGTVATWMTASLAGVLA